MVIMEALNTAGANMGVWANHMAAENMSPSAAWMEYARETKADTQEVFDALDLPTYKRILTTKQSFRPEQIEAFRFDAFWLQIFGSEEKTTKLNLTRDELLQEVGDPSIDETTGILVSEFLENKYGGNMVVSDNGQIVIEFGKGTNSDYTARNVTPSHFAISEPGTGTMQYSFADIKLRELVWNNVIRPIRQGGEPLPGYFEFIVADNDEVIFVDARPTNPIYRLGHEIVL